MVLVHCDADGVAAGRGHGGDKFGAQGVTGVRFHDGEGAKGQCACLVEGDAADRAEGKQGVGGMEDDPVLDAHGHAGGRDGGDGEGQRTRARHRHDGDGVSYRVDNAPAPRVAPHVVADEQPDQKADERRRARNGQEPLGYTVRKVAKAASRALRVHDGLDDARKRVLAGEARDGDVDAALDERCAGAHCLSLGTEDGHRLARDCRLVNVGTAGEDGSVGRHYRGGSDANHVVVEEQANIDGLDAVLRDHLGGGGLQLGEGRDGAEGGLGVDAWIVRPR